MVDYGSYTYRYNNTRRINVKTFQSTIGQGQTVDSASLSSINDLASDAALWGKGIPISWGRRKLKGYMLQMSAIRKVVDYADVVLTSTQAGFYNQKSTVHYKYVVDYAFALGYPGDGGDPKTLLKVWLGDTLIYNNASGQTRNQSVNFYPGSATQNPDPVLKAANPDQPAYRGLMYGVLTGFDALASDGKVPDLYVELADVVTVSMPITNVNESSYATSLSINRAFYDSREGFLYLEANLPLFSGARGFAKFDSTTGAFISGVPITGSAGGSSFPGFLASSFCGFYGDGQEEKFAFGQPNGASNCSPLVLVNLETGAVVDSLGIYFNFPNPAADIYGLGVYAQTIRFEEPSRTRVFALHNSGLFGNNATFLKVFDTLTGPKIKRLNVIGTFSGNCYLIPGPITDDGTLTCYFVRGNVVDKITITQSDGFARQTGWYTGAQTIIGGLRAQDGNPVFFMDNGSGLTKVAKVDATNPATELWSITNQPVPTEKALRFIQNGEAQGKEVYFWRANAIRRIDLMSGAYETQTDTSGYNFTGTVVTNPPIWDSITGNFIAINSPTVSFIRARALAANSILLSDFLRDLCVLCGYATGDITISGISDTITGAIITPPFTLKDVLANLGAVFNFETFEVDGKITIKRRGRGGSFVVDKTIPASDRALLEEGGSEQFPSLGITRSSDDDLPATVTLTYLDPDYDYNPVTFTWKRPSGVSNSTATESYTVPIIMTEAQAGALVAQMVFDIFSSRMAHAFRLGTKYLQLAPGDVVKIVGDGVTDTVKIEQVTVNADFSQSYVGSAISSDSGPTFSPDPFDTVEAPDNNQTGKSYVLPVDTPYIPFDLNLSTVLETYLVAIPAERGNWQGGVFYRSSDGQNYGAIGAVDASPTFGRYATTFAADGNPNSIHYGQTFDLFLSRGSVADFVAPAGGGADLLVDPTPYLLFYGKPGRWEIMAFGSVTADVAANKVTLGDYIRGLYGTDGNVNNHAVGDYMILWKRGRYYADTTPFSELGKTFLYKAAAPLFPLAYAQSQSITFKGNSDRPWPVAIPAAAKVGSDIVITWAVRDRSETTLHDGDGNVTIQGNDLDSYDLEIYSGTTLKRTVSGIAGQSYTYLSANIAADGFTFASLTSLRVIIYQLSSTLGRGFPKDVTLDVY